MKKLILAFILIYFSPINAQNQYDESTHPDNMVDGVYFQSGPGSNNTLNWTYNYGTKLTVENSSFRNFEILATHYPYGLLKLRQFDPTNNIWTNWRAILTEDENGNVGIGTDSPSSKLHVMGNITNTGQIVTYNPTNPNASVALSWQNNIARIRIGGSGNGASSGFHFQGTGDKTLLRINGNGDIGIGTTTPDAKLTVAGNIHSREVKVTVNAGADFVFEDNYNLPTLEDVQQFIQENGHLPEIASAKGMEENGIQLGEMNIKLLQKIEELMLYAIEQEKEIETLKDLTLKVSAQGEEIEALKKLLNQLLDTH